MPKTRRNAGVVAEHLDTLAAIWILASNDERPEISYMGLRHRLRLAGHVDERRLVADRGELFRLSIPESPRRAQNELSPGQPPSVLAPPPARS